MNQDNFYETTWREFSEGAEEETEVLSEPDHVPTNRIFLNFTSEFRHPAKDRYNRFKVKGLFRYLAERPDLQAMKICGWLDEECDAKNEREERYAEEYQLDSFYGDEERTQKGGGQRFAMSRDFWYRKLNILKAQKLDEVALEARDIPGNSKSKIPKCVKYLKTEKKIFSDEIPVKKKDVIRELNCFNDLVAKPVEKILKKRFVNVYENLNGLSNS